MPCKCLSAAVCALMLAVSAAQAATPFLYECDMNRVEQGRGWISGKIALILPGDGTVKIVDAVILHINKVAIQGTILRDTPRRLIVKWTVKGAKANNGLSFANFDYRASLAKSSGKIELTAMPREFDSGLRSTGSCRKRTQ